MTRQGLRARLEAMTTTDETAEAMPDGGMLDQLADDADRALVALRTLAVIVDGEALRSKVADATQTA